MAEQEGKVGRLVSIDVAEKLEVMQDEVDLMKIEIKQALVDLREFIIKDRAPFPQPSPATHGRVMQESLESEIPAGVYPSGDSPPPLSVETRQPRERTRGDERPHDEGLDPIMLGSIIRWLGTIKHRGLSLQQITPYLEAYEMSGYLTSLMVKVVLRAMADLDQLAETPHAQEFSPENYSECVSELHDIICRSAIDTDDTGPLAANSISKPATREAYRSNLVDAPNLDGNRAHSGE